MKTYTVTQLLLVSLLAACSNSNQGSSLVSGGAAGTGSVAGSGGSVNTAGTPSAGGSLNLGGNINGGASGGGAGGAGGAIDDACATGSSQATLAQLTLFVMFDDSGSMGDSPSGQSASKWVQASAAMRAFFSDPSAAGMQVWLRLFPSNDLSAPNCTQLSCSNECNSNCGLNSYPKTRAACAIPLVPVGTLTAASAPADTQEQALLAAIPANATLGNSDGATPMSAALQGVEDAAAAYAQANPMQAQHTIVVLVTDGQPNGCDQNIPDIASIASDQLAATGIKTYAIGLAGSRQKDMNAIAKAGGTTTGIFIGNGTSTQQDLFNAFGAIKAANAACDFDVPMPPAGQVLDPTRVNVDVTLNGGTPVELGGVQSVAQCGTQQSWYYATPAQITLCPSACQAVQADPTALVQVLFGCSTNQVPPK